MGEWHVDVINFVFVAFGDIASIECIRGPFKKEPVWKSMRERTATGLEESKLEAKQIPNGVPVALTHTTVHRKGQIERSGIRISMQLGIEDLL